MPTPHTTPSINPNEVTRLKKELRDREQALLDTRFLGIEERLDHLDEGVFHECLHKSEWPKLYERFETMSRIRFWSVVGSITGLIIAALVAVYNFAQESSKWTATSDKVNKIEGAVGKMDWNVQSMTVSLKLLEQEQRVTREKLEKTTITPEQIEAAVRKGLKK